MKSGKGWLDYRFLSVVSSMGGWLCMERRRWSIGDRRVEAYLFERKHGGGAVRRLESDVARWQV